MTQKRFLFVAYTIFLLTYTPLHEFAFAVCIVYSVFLMVYTITGVCSFYYEQPIHNGHHIVHVWERRVVVGWRINSVQALQWTYYSRKSLNIFSTPYCITNDTLYLLTNFNNTSVSFYYLSNLKAVLHVREMEVYKDCFGAFQL